MINLSEFIRRFRRSRERYARDLRAILIPADSARGEIIGVLMRANIPTKRRFAVKADALLIAARVFRRETRGATTFLALVAATRPRRSAIIATRSQKKLPSNRNVNEKPVCHTVEFLKETSRASMCGTTVSIVNLYVSELVPKRLSIYRAR